LEVLQERGETGQNGSRKEGVLVGSEEVEDCGDEETGCLFFGG